MLFRSVDAHSSDDAATDVPPLPGGEGRGEGGPENTFRFPTQSPIDNQQSSINILFQRSARELVCTESSLFIAPASWNFGAAGRVDTSLRSALTPALSPACAAEAASARRRPGERVERLRPVGREFTRRGLDVRRGDLHGSEMSLCGLD